ncbi:hypothetical protein GCM10009678_88430 [Actinomadura kijaniata]
MRPPVPVAHHRVMDMNKDIAPTDRKLRRTRDGKMVAGVCAGVGRYFGVDPNLVRLGLGAFTFFGGAGIALYAIAWLVMPEDGAPASVGEDLLKKAEESPAVQDMITKAKVKAREVHEKATSKTA